MKIINRWQCWIVGLWWSIKNGTRFSGCNFTEQEFHENMQVSVCKCDRCGKCDIGWGKNLK